jgi:DUF4097 and DUF4098 domain-containing protein YvlB
MKKLIALLMAVPLVAWIALASDHKGTRGSGITLNDDELSDNCAAHLHMYNDDFRSYVRDEETRSLPNQPLTITAERNGGIEVSTWDQPEFSIKLCKQVATNDESEGRRLLSETKLAVHGGNVSISAPSSDGYHSLGTLLLVKAPRNATVSMSVHNGGVSLNRFIGTAEAHAHNGGISFKQSSGKLTAEAQNGGVSIKDCSGEVDASVQNGGLSISLAEHWEGKGLEARAHNGGLVVAVPKNFSGGLEVVGPEHTSIVCKDSICDDAQRTWDSGHKMFRLGSGNPQIHATTENGGIVIKERESSRSEM